ncbi:MAG: hypothetical protein KME03_17860 [Aphanocapsa lilacina HA4352-LM1]|uniref:hypothetical protein n=1 Tax=Gloeobacter violaceus TaxID=33072 RepID=UPI0002EFA5EB|nr:hypothetical protein [Gloeobacter violaceus]MBW4699722.1 hypothetical protein [Aphanocapsa lilacina HA4352-LM1]
MQQPIKTPEMLELAAEKMFLDVTEPLDSFISLKLLQVVRSLIRISYTMGHQDATRLGANGAPCAVCPHKGDG